MDFCGKNTGIIQDNYSRGKIIEFFGCLYIVFRFFYVYTFFIMNLSNNLRNNLREVIYEV